MVSSLFSAPPFHQNGKRKTSRWMGRNAFLFVRLWKIMPAPLTRSLYTAFCWSMHQTHPQWQRFKLPMGFPPLSNGGDIPFHPIFHDDGGWWFQPLPGCWSHHCLFPLKSYSKNRIPLTDASRWFFVHMGITGQIFIKSPQESPLSWYHAQHLNGRYDSYSF